MKTAVLALFASALLAAPMAFAQKQPASTERNRPTANEMANWREGMVNRHVDRLALVYNLTPEQKKEARIYFTDAFDANQPVEMHLREARKNLANDIKAQANQNKLTADTSEIGHDEGQILANNAHAQEQFISILNRQEQSKYEKLEGPWISGFPQGMGGVAPGLMYR